MARRRAFRLVVLCALAACSGPAPRDLEELVIRDSAYLEPGTLEPYTGDVFGRFPGSPDDVQIRGTLRNGTWQGELTVFHPNGRIRFQGELVDGVQCGAWVEDADPEPAESVYEGIVAEIENLSLYPPCPES